jgi:hypothetical protein
MTKHPLRLTLYEKCVKNATCLPIPVACSQIEHIPNQNDDSPKQLISFRHNSIRLVNARIVEYRLSTGKMILCNSKRGQGWRTADESVVVSIVFFTGKLEKLLYLTSHLFLAFLLPNYIKSCVWKKPWLFEVVKTVVRWVVSLSYGIIWLVTFGWKRPRLYYCNHRV